ncbi:MAG: hypothetical protein MUE46_20930, partial [Xanthomonadales bacterium]|nr:hypothetical protein [Xanthomonadales bacterium]
SPMPAAPRWRSAAWFEASAWKPQLDVVECALPVLQGKAQRGGIAAAIPTRWNAALCRWKRAIRHVTQFTRPDKL